MIFFRFLQGVHHHNAPISAYRREGQIRESLAAYFLSSPPSCQKTAHEKKRCQRALRCLAELEVQTLLRLSDVRRPLRYGDLTGLLTSTVRAAQLLLQKKDIRLHCQFPSSAVCTAAEPRLLQVAVTQLIRSYAAVNPRHTIRVSISDHPNNVVVSLSSAKRPRSTRGIPLARTAAALHKGSVVLSGGTTAFSIAKDLPNAIGLFTAPSPEELLTNPLSAVYCGLA